MTYDEYIAQQQQAMDEEQQEDSCFLEYQPEGQFVREKSSDTRVEREHAPTR